MAMRSTLFVVMQIKRSLLFWRQLCRRKKENKKRYEGICDSNCWSSSDAWSKSELSKLKENCRGQRRAFRYVKTEAGFSRCMETRDAGLASERDYALTKEITFVIVREYGYGWVA